MKNYKGFVGLGLILVIIAVLAVGAGAYYLGTKDDSMSKNVEENNQLVKNESHEVRTGPFGDESNYISPKPISCNSNTTPWIQVLSPNGGEIFTLGQAINIKWDSKCIDSNEKILIGINRVVQNQDMAVEDVHEINTTNTGSYYWVIPKNLSIGKYEAEVAFLYGNNDAATSKSTNLFTINSATPIIWKKSPKFNLFYQNTLNIIEYSLDENGLKSQTGFPVFVATFGKNQDAIITWGGGNESSCMEEEDFGVFKYGVSSLFCLQGHRTWIAHASARSAVSQEELNIFSDFILKNKY